MRNIVAIVVTASVAVGCSAQEKRDCAVTYNAFGVTSGTMWMAEEPKSKQGWPPYVERFEKLSKQWAAKKGEVESATLKAYGTTYAAGLQRHVALMRAGLARTVWPNGQEKKPPEQAPLPFADDDHSPEAERARALRAAVEHAAKGLLGDVVSPLYGEESHELFQLRSQGMEEARIGFLDFCYDHGYDS